MLLLSPEDQDLYRYQPTQNSSDYYWVNHYNVGDRQYTYWSGEFVHRVVMWRILQVLLPPRSLVVVDHINGNKHDNRRENLQLISHSRNKLKGNTASGKLGYLRVYKVSRNNSFRVQLKINNKHEHYGVYYSLEEAAFWADVWTYRLLSPEATLNFPERLEEIREEALKITNPNHIWQRDPYADILSER